ncbi:Protein YIF1B [Linum perenne]
MNQQGTAIPTPKFINPFGDPFSSGGVAGSGLIRGGLGAYGEKILGSGSDYVQSNGHWTRITEPVGGRLSYKPPVNDINAPDLYIPCMAFATYLVLAGISLGLSGKFSPEALNWQFVKGMVGWVTQVMLLKVSLLSLGGGEAPVLDVVAYAGYTFTGMCIAMMGRIVLHYASYYLIIIWTCLCMAVFLVKTMKRTLFAEVRCFDGSSRHHYLLLGVALTQFPLIFWLSNTSGNWA